MSVNFVHCSLEKYLQADKNEDTLYFVDEGYVYKGSKLMSSDPNVLVLESMTSNTNISSSDELYDFLRTFNTYIYSYRDKVVYVVIPYSLAIHTSLTTQVDVTTTTPSTVDHGIFLDLSAGTKIPCKYSNETSLFILDNIPITINNRSSAKEIAAGANLVDLISETLTIKTNEVYSDDQVGQIQQISIEIPAAYRSQKSPIRFVNAQADMKNTGVVYLIPSNKLVPDFSSMFALDAHYTNAYVMEANKTDFKYSLLLTTLDASLYSFSAKSITYTMYTCNEGDTSWTQYQDSTGATEWTDKNYVSLTGFTFKNIIYASRNVIQDGGGSKYYITSNQIESNGNMVSTTDPILEYDTYAYVDNTWTNVGKSSVTSLVANSFKEYAKKTDLPTKTSQLTNDSNYLTSSSLQWTVL